jgi:hypothetical protein
MSESGGTGGAPAGGAPASNGADTGGAVARTLRGRPPPAGAPAADGAPGGERPAPTPLGSTPKLRGGLSIDAATKAIGERRRAAAEGGTDPGTRRAMPSQNGVATTGTAAAAGNGTGNGHAAPADGAASPAGGPDPIDQLLDRMRPGASQAKPAGEGGETEPARRDVPADGFELMLDGKPARFTVDQLTSAIKMAGDYTKKSQELSALARTVNEKAALIDELAPILIPEIQRRIAEMEGTDTEVDWQKLLLEDPAEYHRRDALWKNAQIEKERLAKLAESQTKLTAEETQKRLQTGHAALVEALPGWDDPQMRGRMQSEMIKWGRANRFPDAELSSIYEPRHVIALCKAMMFDRMMNRVQTTAIDVPAVRRGLPPAEPAGRGGTPAVADADAKFRAKPNVNNAVQRVLAQRAAAARR